MSGRITPTMIEVRQGDSFAINIAVQNNNAAADLTGATVVMQVREKDSGNIVFSVTGTPVDVASGKIALLLTPEQTGATVGDYVTDIQITFANGEVHTIYPANISQVATFRITPQVTA